DRVSERFEIEISKDSLPVDVNDSQEIRLLAVSHCNIIMLPIPAFDKSLRNFEHDIFIDALFLDSIDESGTFERITGSESKYRAASRNDHASFHPLPLSHAQK